MDVTVRNGIERCPSPCVHSDIRVYGERKLSATGRAVDGFEVVVTCAHICVCRIACRETKGGKK